jgi:NAD(P)-dependent dehydrogenase (short-subunit alcohol dehydrogenase family)
MTSDYPVVIYGASGYTGRLVAEHLRELGVPFVAAGRNHARIVESLKLVPGIENARYEIAEVEHSVEALTRLFTGRKVVCNTVGPFNRFGMETAEACLRAGAHYLDTTGEQASVRKMADAFDADFKKAGLALIPSLAMQYAVSEIAAQYCLETPGLDSLEMHEVAEAVPTVGSAQTILDSIRQPFHHLKDNELVAYENIEVSQVATPGGRVVTATSWGGSTNPLWFAMDGRIRNCKMDVAMWNQTLYQKQLDLARLYHTTLQWIPEAQLQPILDSMAKQITAASPPREARQVHRSVDWCLATGNNKAVKATIYSTGGYLQTGQLQAYGARRLMSETPRATGFRSPSTVFGHRELMGALESYGYAAIKVERIV